MTTIKELEEAIFGVSPEAKPLAGSVFGSCPKCQAVIVLKEIGTHFQLFHEEKQYGRT